MNHDNEYWYIGSILLKLDIQKNNIDEWTETGWYPLRTVSISSLVSSATFWETKDKKKKSLDFFYNETHFEK